MKKSIQIITITKGIHANYASTRPAGKIAKDIVSLLRLYGFSNEHITEFCDALASLLTPSDDGSIPAEED